VWIPGQGDHLRAAIDVEREQVTTEPLREAAEPLVLCCRHPVGASNADDALLLPLSAEERTRWRGRRRTVCGRTVLLQLPRTEPLQPGEVLSDASHSLEVRVVAALEPLLQVRAPSPLALLQAAYHLGNRHVALELQDGELRLLEDSVLAEMLRCRGLQVETCCLPFHPEGGAYPSGAGHHHHHPQP
jgi:urease accessory protein